jgi:long-subunit fatty acid transport protein
MRVSLIAIFLMALASITGAQDLGEFEEVTAGNFYGIGARQMSMGGTGIASSWDGAALFYNPAALARIHRIEFQLGMTHQKFSNETSQPSDRYDGFSSIKSSASTDLTKTRLGSINLTLPVPTYRGSLVVSFGAHRIMSFDRVAAYNVIDRNAIGQQVEDYASEFETGAIFLYSVGAGVDISPHLSLGLALNVYSGKDEFNYEFTIDDETNDYYYRFSNQITEDYIGASLKGGLLARPNANLDLGFTIESPLDYQVEFIYDFSEYDPDFDPPDYREVGSVEYDLQRPFIFGAGAAFRFSTFTLAADAEYVDWSQLSYNDNQAMEMFNDTLTDLYRDVFNLRVGAEYQIPSAGLALRAGLFSNPMAYHKAFVKDDRGGYSLGFGWLIDKVLMLETAFVHGDFKRRFRPDNASVVDNKNAAIAIAEDSFSRLFITMSYRY